MTIIEKIPLNEKENSNLLVFEAPYSTSSSFQRRMWIEQERPFFAKEIQKFWKIYSTSFSAQDEVILSKYEELCERQKFARYPLYIASVKNKVVGGIWYEINVPNKAKTKDKKNVHFHIKFLRENRNLAYPLLQHFINEQKNAHSLNCAWGPREKTDDPTNFFKNNGFEIIQQDFKQGGYAKLNLEDLFKKD